jgi:hypothetical protein
MKHKQHFVINIALAIFIIVLMILVGTLFEINKPKGLILFIVMGVISIISLLFLTIFLPIKQTTPSGLALMSSATYVMQASPFLIFLLASDEIINGKLIIIPISLVFLVTISYLVFIFLFGFYNKISVEHDRKIVGKVNPVQNEEEYYNDDGSFKGAK